jgi:hypothetical protein
VRLITLHCKKIDLLQNVTKSLGLGWILWINNLSYGKWMRLGKWKVRSQCMTGSLMTVAKEI